MNLRNLVVPVLALGLAPPAAARTWNLFEWMAVAPLVVVGEVQVDDQRYIEIRAVRVFRGDASEGDVVRIDQRAANRDRAPNTPRLAVAKGDTYLWLLQPRHGRDEPIYDLVRGTLGARLVGEGGPALLDAAARMASWQDRRSESQLWEDLARALDDPNPFLVETALDMFAKFHRADARTLGALRRLLDSPRPDFREKAAALTGPAAARAGDSPAAADAFAALVVLARRDAFIAIRAAATRALNDFEGVAAIEALREIARSDPDQAVRYEAQRSLLQRRAPAGGNAIDLPSDAP